MKTKSLRFLQLLTLTCIANVCSPGYAQKRLLTEDKGWKKVTSLPGNSNEYFYALFEHNHDDWGLQFQKGKNQSGNVMVLKAGTNPESQRTALWTLTQSSSETYNFINTEDAGSFYQTEWGKDYFWHTSDNGAGDKKWGEVKLHSLGDAWQLQQAMYSTFLGPWDVKVVCDNEFAGNRTQAEAPAFDIFRIPRGQYFANNVTTEQLKAATPSKPIDLSYLIINNDGDLRNLLGWTQEGMNAQSNDAFKSKNGTYYFERWVSSGALPNSKLTQTLTGLPNGVYKLTASAYYGGSGAVIFANSNTTPVTTTGNYEVTTTVTDGTLNFGGRLVSGTSNYLCYDHFQLFYIGYVETEKTTDITDRLVNPDFEDGEKGWTNNGMAIQSNTSFVEKHGLRYCETWVASGNTVKDVSIEQCIEGLEAGTYTLTVTAQNLMQSAASDKQTGAYIFASVPGISDALSRQQTEFSLPSTYKVTTTTCNGRLLVGAFTKSATGNYVCIDNFRLSLKSNTDFETLHAMMQELLNEAKSISKDNGTSEQQELDEACQAVEELSAANTTEGVTEAVLRLEEAIADYRLSIATSSSSIDMTDHIENPDFEDRLTGWTNVGMQSQTNSDFVGKHGSVYAEAWTPKTNKVANVSVTQQIDVPNGSYRLTAIAHNINQNTTGNLQSGAYLTADDVQKAANGKRVLSGVSYKVQGGDTSLDFVVIDGQAVIGFKTMNSTGNWVAVDNFRLSYIGRSEEALLSALKDRIEKAITMSAEPMNQAQKQQLEEAIAAAQAVSEAKGMEPVALQLRQSMDEAQTSMNAYASLKQKISDMEVQYNTAKNGAPEFMAAIQSASALYASSTATLAELQAEEVRLDKALLAYRLCNPTGPVPSVSTNSFIARGATGALGRSTVSGSNIKEKGFCWSTEHNPTLLDDHSTIYYDNNGPLYLMQPLKPSTVYYVRAYALTEGYAVAYGEERKVITLPKGNSTYWYNNGGSPEENDRINFALKECVEYYNNWSATTNFNISCSYSAGTPTADCSYGGSMRVGAQASYQRTGTILHESNHGVGVGQQARWWDTNLHNGEWKGYRANRLLQFIDNNNTAVMKGDNLHMWPYGINGASEDNGSPLLYMANVMITQALHEDGLIPPGHGGCKPAYVFEQEDDVKYYITNEDASCGAGTGFLTETADGRLVWKVVNEESPITKDDAYAWYTSFDPVRQLYTLRNAKSGRYFSYRDGIKTISTTPTDKEYFHMMVARYEGTMGTAPNQLTSRSYWVMAGADEATPLALTATSSGTTESPRFDIADGASKQRWYFLTASEYAKLHPIEDLGLAMDYNHDNEVNLEDVIALQDLLTHHVKGYTLQMMTELIDFLAR